MSAFRPRAPRGPAALTGSQHRRALRAEGGKAGVRFRDLSRAYDKAEAIAASLPEGSWARARAAHRARRIAFGLEEARIGWENYAPCSSAEKHPGDPAHHRGLPADAHPTRRRGRPNPRWAGMATGIRHHGGPYAYVPLPKPRLQKKRRPEGEASPRRQRAATGEVV